MKFRREHFPKAMAAVEKRTCAYLNDEIGLVVTVNKTLVGNIDLLELRKVTTIVGTGGPVNLLIAFGFDPGLLDCLCQIATGNLEITADERELFLRETAAETVNFILGHATADLAETNNHVTLSPPVVLEGGRCIHRPKKAMFATIEMSTIHGILDIYFIGPSELFDQRLNILSEEEQPCPR
jgi:CheY-specific phosphatase CheX